MSASPASRSAAPSSPTASSPFCSTPPPWRYRAPSPPARSDAVWPYTGRVSRPRPSRRVSRLIVSATLALALTTVLALAQHARLFATAQVAASDLLFKTRAAERARSTVIVGIDQRSYQTLLPAHGPLSQWPRTLYARALDMLRDRGPRVVAFEIFFDAERPEDRELAAAVL